MTLLSFILKARTGNVIPCDCELDSRSQLRVNDLSAHSAQWKRAAWLEDTADWALFLSISFME